MEDLRKLLGRELLFFQGAMGTEMQARGLQPGELPDSWNFTHPEIIKELYAAYLDAGANLLKTNTFSANALKLAATEYTPEAIITKGVQLAKEAAAGREKVFVCLDLGPLGKLLQPYGDLPFEEAVRLFAEQVRIGSLAGADAILIETLSDTYEMKAAILAAKENSSLPLLVTLTFDEAGRLLNGADVGTAARLAEALGVDGIGFNCGLGPEQVLKLLPQMRQAVSLPLLVNPNAGLPEEREGRTYFGVGPAEFAAWMVQIVGQGAAVAGGCCGAGPEHIRALTEACRNLPCPAEEQVQETYCTSYGRTVFIGRDPQLIGERINPTGKKLLQEALKQRDLDYICRMGWQQVEAGAQILDVNAGTPGVNEEELLSLMVPALQGITDIPLQIDTSNFKAMEKALRLYNGVPLLNSVNGAAESWQGVLPLAARYGATVVCLTLDENGIPSTVQGRVALAEKIAKLAQNYGIPQRRLVIDPLALTIGTGAENAQICLATIRELEKRGFKTVLGVSNISYGLPNREVMNKVFFGLALEAGLNLGIINPLSQGMMETYYGYRALAGWDENFKEYVGKFGQTKVQVVNKESNVSLYDAIVQGMIGEARATAQKALQKQKPLEIIDGELIPALNFVGEGFEKKTVFLPQLLMSADAAKAAFEEIRQGVGSSEAGGPVVVLATVQGDIHDIGKNIVKALMENYGLRVIDLGKDVAPEVIVRTAQEEKAAVVGLSALMTTTVKAMEITIQALHAAKVAARILVGGAVLTADYAVKIGADGYAPNAVAAVRFVKD